MKAHFSGEQDFVHSVQRVVAMVFACLVLVFVAAGFYFLSFLIQASEPLTSASDVEDSNMNGGIWQAPDSTLIPETAEGDLIRYGRALIAHTAKYLGPKGSVKPISNGMNCQNCHLKAGTKPFGNNYAAVASTYPKLRARSGKYESIRKRINDCLERSLNGSPLDSNSREMQAIIAYFQWLGKDVKKGFSPNGTGITAIPILNRAAHPGKGRAVYARHCQPCHGVGGVGLRHPDSAEWKYPPLAGANSFTVSAGLYRLSRMAGYVKSNMPNGTTYENPVLSDEEAWDVAAYINSLPRPDKRFSGDWPDITKKPFDHPFGPYSDSFPESRHKFGPFGAIQQAGSVTVRGEVP